jgi:hypothetical protein
MDFDRTPAFAPKPEVNGQVAARGVANTAPDTSNLRPSCSFASNYRSNRRAIAPYAREPQ